MPEKAKPHGGNRGACIGDGERLNSGSNPTTARGACQLRAANGRVVAQIEGDRLEKQVDGSRHFLRKPAGIAFDDAILEAAERAGAHTVSVRDRETGNVYTCQLQDFAILGVQLNRGFGPQRCLPFNFWHVRRAGEPVQLGLFGGAA